VVGYVVYVDGMPAFFGGRGVLPNAAMLPNDITNIASVSKMITTIAALKSMSNHNITLDSPITKYMYSDWQSIASNSVRNITFGQLLTHRSGFPANGSGGQLDCGGDNTSYATLKLLIQSSVIPPLISTAPGVYSNCNFAIFRELLPQMEQDPSVNATPDDILQVNPRAQLSASFYINYVNQYVLGPSNVAGLRNCAPTSNSNLQMLSYPVPPATTPNTNWGDWTLSCGGGGWNLSAFDMLEVFRALGTGNLLSAAQQQQIYVSDPNHPGLGWDNTVANCPGATANGQTYYWCKNGFLGGSARQAGIETFAGLFKCNAVPVIVVVNSPIPSNINITSVVTTAFNSPAVQIKGYTATCQTHNVGQ
jgi:CubicO group peptidase (beta-lactamase class C family)